MDLEFTGEMWFWRGPAPRDFVTVPDDECQAIAPAASLGTSGWGMIPVAARIGRTGWTTSLWPKDGKYVVPVKTSVRQAEGIEGGGSVGVRPVGDAARSGRA